LPFLRPEEVGECFSQDLMAIQPNDKQIKTFCDYVLDNYISPDVTFPPDIWSEFAATAVRTTNSCVSQLSTCESYHAVLNRRFYSPHPDIFNFVDELLQIQSETNIELRSTIQKKKITLGKEKYLREQMMKYTNNIIT